MSVCIIFSITIVICHISRSRYYCFMALENVDSKDMPTYNIFLLYLCYDTFKFIINLNYIGFHIMLTKSTGLFHYDAVVKIKFNDSNF